MFSSQEISSGLVSFYMIFEALQSALFGLNFHSLSSKILKIPEFNLVIALVSLEMHSGTIMKQSQPVVPDKNKLEQANEPATRASYTGEKINFGKIT